MPKDIIYLKGTSFEGWGYQVWMAGPETQSNTSSFSWYWRVRDTLDDSYTVDIQFSLLTQPQDFDFVWCRKQKQTSRTLKERAFSIKKAVLSCCSHVWLFVTLWIITHQVPLSMGFSRQEYWSGLLCLPPGDPPNPEIQPMSRSSSALAGGFFTASATWEAQSFWAFPSNPVVREQNREEKLISHQPWVLRRWKLRNVM